MSTEKMTKFEMVRTILILIALISAVQFLVHKYNYYSGYNKGQADIVNQLDLRMTIEGWVPGENCSSVGLTLNPEWFKNNPRYQEMVTLGEQLKNTTNGTNTTGGK